MEEIARERGGAKSSITERITALARYVAEGDCAVVEYKLQEVKDAFRYFENVHNKYHFLLKKDEDIIASDTCFEEVQKNYVIGVSQSQSYLNDFASAHVSETKPTKTCSHVRLPPAPQPTIFDGRPLTYSVWKASFSSLIEREDLGLALLVMPVVSLCY